MKNIIALLLVSVILFLGCSDRVIEPTQKCTFEGDIIVNENHPKGAAIQAKIDEFIGKGIPGMTILINDDDGFWISSGGYADLENQIKMEPCHVNKLGSVTKMMMGTLVWQLIQDGDLNIDDLISKYIPTVSSRIENGSEITLGQLIAHTSGIYDIARDLNFNLAVINDFSRSWTEEEILGFIEDKPATGTPGEKVSYSNSNTMLIGLIIDAATGKPHGELLKERIFDPLFMTNTVYYDYTTEFPSEYLAQGYLDLKNDGKSIQNISDLNPGSGNGYTGVYSTVVDLYLFMDALLRKKTLTTPENLDLIFASMRAGENGNWKSSIGAIHDEHRDIFEEGIHCYGHAGGDIGYSANLNYLPHNNTIFAATYNYGTNLPTDLGDELHTLRWQLKMIMAE